MFAAIKPGSRSSCFFLKVGEVVGGRGGEEITVGSRGVKESEGY
jgi:hypothetical protein